MRLRQEIETDLRTLKSMESNEDVAKKGVFLLLDLMDNQQLLLEALLDIRELLKKKRGK